MFHLSSSQFHPSFLVHDLALNITSHWIFNISSMMGATSGAENAFFLNPDLKL